MQLKRTLSARSEDNQHWDRLSRSRRQEPDRQRVAGCTAQRIGEDGERSDQSAAGKSRPSTAKSRCTIKTSPATVPVDDPTQKQGVRR
jgi:hypothetical protein